MVRFRDMFGPVFFAGMLVVGMLIVMAGTVAAAEPFRPAGEWFRDEPPVRVDDAGRPAPTTRDDVRRPIDRNGMPAGYSPSGYGAQSNYGTGYAGYPAYEVNNWVGAQARAATARMLFRQAEMELSGAFRAAQRQFELSPEWKQATSAERAAFDALLASRRRATQGLMNDQKYQRLIALHTDAAERLAQGRASKSLSPAEILAMATLKMHYATDMRHMEADAMADEPSVKDAQDKLIAAGQKITEMRAAHEEGLRRNPEILAARRMLEDARIAKITAETYARGTTIAGTIALDYAYWSNRHNYGYGYYDPYYARY